MTKSGRALLLLALLVGFQAGTLPQRAARAFDAVPRPGVSMQYDLVCSAPGGVVGAVRLLGRHGINPSRAVKTETGLPLTLIETGKRIVPTASRHVVIPTLDYGNVPAPIPTPDAPTPAGEPALWVQITETLPHGPAQRGIRFYPGPSQSVRWQLGMQLTGRHKVVIGMRSDSTKRILRQIATALVGEDRP